MEEVLNKILEKLDNMESDLKEIKPKVEEIYSLKPKIEESHQWLSALRYIIEGVLQGFDKSLEILKKAQ